MASRAALITLLLLAATLCASCLPMITQNTCAPGNQFVDSLAAEDTQCWWRSDKYANNDPAFLTGWRKDHVLFNGSYMSIYLDDHGCNADPDGCSGKTYASGEYQSLKEFGHGTYTVRMDAAKGCGLVNGFFLLHYVQDPTTHQLLAWEEIDIEVLGKDPSKVQFNYRSGKGVQLKNPPVISLGPPKLSQKFDASAGFHDYSFEWTPTEIKWYIRDPGTQQMVEVHKEDGSSLGTDGKPLPLPSSPQKIFMNLWAGCDSWSGCTAEDPQNPRCWDEESSATARFDLVSYTPP